MVSGGLFSKTDQQLEKKKKKKKEREKRLHWRIIEFLLLFVKVIGFKVIYVLDLKGFAI